MKNANRQNSWFRGQAGFTLIELAIVLVIIGIIIGAVLKGQDLVENGRHKRLGAEIKQWEVLIWTYFDRERRFPGDGDNSGKGDGTIGENGEANDNAKSDFTTAAFASQPSTNTLTLGSSTFYIYFGNAGTKKNAIIVCTSELCDATFSEPEETGYAKFFDGAIDDTVSASDGRVRAFNGFTGTPSSAKWTATLTATSTTGYTSAMKAFAYFFDRKL
ncbi:MAG: prepilin-type N-terminal cleavage/methylation domain-containing protein [Nitrospirae bacterium]|nr:prepilin-type N-terminal cleavage/methylation domain-containing protein [Nitrospirota bacterium]MCL5977914.1 prepilin-type N-terminal cleavage/methylation domain-containing protein [Nitrospirota bacterium]